MGGAIAQEIAIAYPARVRSLTSIMSTTGDPKLPGPRPEALARLGKKVPLDRAGYVREYVTTWSVLAGDHFPFDAERTARQGAAAYDRGINPPGVARQMMAIVASGNRTRALRQLRVPTLVIHGTADPLIPDAAGRATGRRDPRRAAPAHRRNGTLVPPRSVAHHHRRDRPSRCAGRRITGSAEPLNGET